MILLKRKVQIDIRIAITTITTIRVMTEEAVPASVVSTGRVTGVPTKIEADRITAMWMISRTMKNTDGGAETKMNLEVVNVNANTNMNVAKAKTKAKNAPESTTNITSGIGGRRATLANEETTIAATKSGIVAVAVEARLA
jgi:hypothetical protein